MAKSNGNNVFKSNKGLVGLFRGIVTRCPSYEPDPEGRNRIQVCIPELHGLNNKDNTEYIGSGNAPGKFPWAMMSFGGGRISGATTGTDLSGTDSGDGGDFSAASKYIFIGDSRTVQMKAAVDGSTDQTGTDIWSCKGSQGLSWMKSTGVPAIESSVDSDTKVVIWMGVNDLGNKTQYPTYINEKYSSWSSKGASVMVVSVGPVNSNYHYYSAGWQAFNAKIDEFNTYMKSHLTNGIEYLDLSSKVTIKTYDSEGIHYGSNDYKNIYKAIKEYGGSGSFSALGGNAAKIGNYLASKGLFNKAAIVGILANIQRESSFDPSAVGDSGTSFGICQWHAGRGSAMKSYVGSNWASNITGQCNYLIKELQESYTGVYNHLRGVANTLNGAKSASDYFVAHFEIPSGISSEQSLRRGYVDTIWNKVSSSRSLRATGDIATTGYTPDNHVMNTIRSLRNSSLKDSKYKSKSYKQITGKEMSSSFRHYLKSVIFGEFGADRVGAMLIAQCLRDAIASGYCGSTADKIGVQYDGYDTGYNANSYAEDAVSYIFDQGNYVVQHRILLMYATYISSSWHESQIFVVQHDNVRFFDAANFEGSGSGGSGKTYTPRLSFDDVVSGSEAYQYYYGNGNIFTASGYGLPNCTCYAYGRAWELLGSKPNLPGGNAGTWVSTLGGAYPVNDYPQLGDIGCWSGGVNGGHVAVVEEISEDGTEATISQSGWQSDLFWTSKIYKSNNWACFSGYSLNGFIHISDFDGTSGGSVGDGSYTDASGSGIVVDPYPHVGDTVWVTFESGDIRIPIITGTMKPGTDGALDTSSLGGVSSDDGSLAKLAAPIIVFEEVGVEESQWSTRYDSIVGNDNGGLSLGLLGWHEDNAKKIVSKIKSTDSAAFDGATDSELNSKLNVSWHRWIIYEDTSIWNTLKKVLRLDASGEVQKAAVYEDIQGYFDVAKSYGVTDNAALIYAADLHNQGGAGALKLCVNQASKPITLDSLHDGAMKTYMGNYSTRRNRVKQKIEALKSSGKLDEASTTSATGEVAKIISVARGEVGNGEDSSGKTKYGTLFGNPTGHWCMYFIGWCAKKVGISEDRFCYIGIAGTGAKSTWQSKGMWYDKSGYTPRAGDLVEFSGHVGLVWKVANGKIYTVEGNTGIMGSNGQRDVVTDERSFEINSPKIIGYARPKYK